MTHVVKSRPAAPHKKAAKAKPFVLTEGAARRVSLVSTEPHITTTAVSASEGAKAADAMGKPADGGAHADATETKEEPAPAPAGGRKSVSGPSQPTAKAGAAPAAPAAAAATAAAAGPADAKPAVAGLAARAAAGGNPFLMADLKNRLPAAKE
jgi:hypothetical protein